MSQAMSEAGSTPGRKKEALGIVLFTLIAAVGVTLLHLWLLGP